MIEPPDFASAPLCVRNHLGGTYLPKGTNYVGNLIAINDRVNLSPREKSVFIPVKCLEICAIP